MAGQAGTRRAGPHGAPGRTPVAARQSVPRKRRALCADDRGGNGLAAARRSGRHRAGPGCAAAAAGRADGRGRRYRPCCGGGGDGAPPQAAAGCRRPRGAGTRRRRAAACARTRDIDLAEYRRRQRVHELGRLSAPARGRAGCAGAGAGEPHVRAAGQRPALAPAARARRPELRGVVPARRECGRAQLVVARFSQLRGKRSAPGGAGVVRGVGPGRA